MAENGDKKRFTCKWCRGIINPGLGEYYYKDNAHRRSFYCCKEHAFYAAEKEVTRSFNNKEKAFLEGATKANFNLNFLRYKGVTNWTMNG